PPANKWKSFRLALIVNLAVDLQPGLLFIGREVVQYFHQVANHLLANPPDEGRAFRGDADHHFPAVIERNRAHDVAKILQAGDQTARRRGGVPHLLRNCRHGEHFFSIEVREKKKLRERNVARREFLAETQHKAALHFHYDVGEPFSIRTNWIDGTSCRFRNNSRIQGD